MHGSEEAGPGVLPSLASGASGTRLRRSGWARTGETSRSQRTWGPWGSAEEEDAYNRGEGVPRQPEFREGDVGWGRSLKSVPRSRKALHPGTSAKRGGQQMPRPSIWGPSCVSSPCPMRPASAFLRCLSHTLALCTCSAENANLPFSTPCRAASYRKPS